MASALHSILFCMFCVLALDKISPYVEVPSDVQRYLQPSLVSDSDYFSDLSCYRPCEDSAPPRICYYKWQLSNYKTMGPACRSCPANLTDCFRNQCITADGHERGILTVNHQIPGPSIQVCLGDRIIVDVVNKLPGQSTTIHWHGVQQKGTPHMDGVPMVTQCPITEHTTFRYDFIATQVGTLYWHSHSGVQKQDGIQGALVIRTPKSLDPNSHLYDYDLASHVIFISDWTRSAATGHVPGLQTHDKFQYPDSILLNGRGRNMVDVFCPETPYNVFRVRQGKKYRFRLVGGTCTSCAYRFSIEQHTLLIIAVDGSPIEPVRVNSIDMSGGERYDFVLEASEIPRSYWIHVKSIGNCEELQVYTLGILRYKGLKFNTLTDPGYMAYSGGKVMNVLNGTCSNRNTGVCIDQLVSLYPVPQRITTREPDVTFKLIFGFHQFSVDDLFQPGKYESYFEPRDNILLSSVVNNISFQFPSSPLLSQRGDISQSVFCPTGCDGLPRCPPGSEDFCKCVHVVRIPLHAVAQFILIDKGGGSINHPFHMHGYYFNVITMGKFKNGQNEDHIIEDLRRGTLKISKSPAFKDTIAVPASGYSVIRILADNPGYWFFHCHVLYHAGAGMALVLQVGEDGDMLRPPVGFPKCGDFVPPVYGHAERTFPSHNLSNNILSTAWYRAQTAAQLPHGVGVPAGAVAAYLAVFSKNV